MKRNCLATGDAGLRSTSRGKIKHRGTDKLNGDCIYWSKSGKKPNN